MKSYKELGSLIFSENNIIGENEIIELIEIESINVKMNEYAGQGHAGMLVGVGSMSPLEGINNYIEIIKKSGEKYKFQILIIYIRDVNILIRIMNFYKEQNINIEFIDKISKNKTI